MERSELELVAAETPEYTTILAIKRIAIALAVAVIDSRPLNRVWKATITTAERVAKPLGLAVFSYLICINLSYR